jgi:hypothetical protein
MQIVELDYAYPSDAIHQRWTAGYRITACASSKLQTAVHRSCSDAVLTGALEAAMLHTYCRLLQVLSARTAVSDWTDTLCVCMWQVFMTIPKRRLANTLQETQRKTAWPADTIAEKWEACM